MKDPYILKNDVLKNKLNILDYDELRHAEADIGFLKLVNVDSVESEFCDEQLLKDIHKHIFEDIFDWAGEFRTVPLYKTELVLPGYSIPYSESKNIRKDLKNRLDKMNSIDWESMSTKELCLTFARELALLWRVHPFRDGNTRTTLSFAYIFAKKRGFPFDMETFTQELDREYNEDGDVINYSIRDKFVVACIDDDFSPQVGPLAFVFQKAMNNYQKNEEHSVKNVL